MDFFKDQRVLVTGGTGFIGSNLIGRLLTEGAHVRATVHRRPPAVRDERIEYLPADLTNPGDCRRALKGVRYVFHCAANSSGAAVMAKTPMVHVTPNVIMNALMLEAAYEAGAEKFLWLASTTGYPVSGERPVREEEMFAGEPYEKYFFVGWMKRFTEVLFRMYGQKLPKPMTTIVLRPTNVYGPNDDFELATSHVTAALIRKVVERWDPIEVWGTGEDVRDVIYVDDMVEAMVTAMAKISSYDVFNIGLGTAYSVKDILQTVIDLDGYEGAPVTFDASKPTMIPVRLVDISKAERALGFRPKTGLRDGLARTIAWYRETRNLPRPAGGTHP